MPNRQILVVTPLTDTGHLNDWHKQIVLALREVDLDVVELTPRNDYSATAIQLLQQLNTQSTSNIGIKHIIDKVISFTERSRKIYGMVQVKSTRMSNLLKKMRRGTLKMLQLNTINLPNSTWNILANVKISLKINKEIEKIFITYMDAVPSQTCRDLFTSLTVPVVPIIFKYSHTEHSRIFKHLPQGSSILTVDENNWVYVRNDFPQIEVLKLPDFSTVESNHVKNHDAQQLFSDSKTVIGLMGSISYRKSLREILEFAQSEQGLNYNWIIAGECFLDRQDDKFRRAFIKLKRKQDGNIRIIDRYLSKSEFDDIFNLVDIHLVLYKEWNSPSNIVTNSILNKKKFVVYESAKIFEPLVLEGLAMSVKEDFTNFVEVIETLKEFRISEDGRMRYLEKSSASDFRKTIQIITRR
jgi:hypothetical protein